MMDQNTCYAIPTRKTKWNLWSDAESTELYAKMSRLHTRLQPYFLTLSREANARGIPLMRHPFLLHPNNPEAWKVEDAFYLGPALYASPVVRRGEILPMLDPTIDTLAPATDPTVVTLDTVKDRLDVLVALAKGDKAQLTLADGTTLTAERVAADGGNPAMLPVATDEAALTSCDGCTLETPGRARVTSTLVAESNITFKDLRIVAKGPSARRIRWDVRLL